MVYEPSGAILSAYNVVDVTVGLGPFFRFYGKCFLRKRFYATCILRKTFLGNIVRINAGIDVSLSAMNVTY